jgi:hypothetical protein
LNDYEISWEILSMTKKAETTSYLYVDAQTLNDKSSQQRAQELHTEYKEQSTTPSNHNANALVNNGCDKLIHLCLLYFLKSICKNTKFKQKIVMTVLGFIMYQQHSIINYAFKQNTPATEIANFTLPFFRDLFLFAFFYQRKPNIKRYIGGLITGFSILNRLYSHSAVSSNIETNPEQIRKNSTPPSPSKNI